MKLGIKEAKLKCLATQGIFFIWLNHLLSNAERFRLFTTYG